MSLERLSAFAKRLATCSLLTQHNGALAFLHIIGLIMQRHLRVTCLVDSEEVGLGAYRGEVDDPDNCGALSASLWELALLLVCLFFFLEDVGC